MRRHWIRVPPDGGDTAKAAVVATALGAGVGLVAFYFTRLFLAREPLPPIPTPAPAEEPPADPAPDPPSLSEMADKILPGESVEDDE